MIVEFIIGFIIGLMLGGVLGFALYAMLVVSKEGNDTEGDDETHG